MIPQRVYITAGQSNAANAGQVRLAPRDPRVLALGPDGWQHARDPQPGAGSGDGGTPWPELGDRLVAAWNEPVGFVATAWGGTTIADWQPGSVHADRLCRAIKATPAEPLRAVLWQQGESDALAGTTAQEYAERLGHLIAASRDVAGFLLPWVIALVGRYALPHGRTHETLRGIAVLAGWRRPRSSRAVREGQRAVCRRLPSVRLGPTTDDLEGPVWRFDGAHFTELGLREVGRRWAEVLLRP